MSVLEAIYQPNAQNHQLNIAAGMASELPFVMLGHSMGAAVAMELEATMRRQQPAWASLFKGCIFLAPFIKVPSLPTPIIWLLRYCIAPLFPEAIVPEWAADPHADYEIIWSNEVYRSYVYRDGYPRNPQGLSWGTNIRYGTGVSMLSLMEQTQQLLSQVDYPFIIVHDPKEQCCLIEGSLDLLEQSMTSKDKKRLIEVDGGLHDLLGNETEAVLRETKAFLADRGLL